MQFTITSARFNIRLTVPAARSTVQVTLASVIFITSLISYKTAQPVQVTGIPFADPDQRTVIFTAAMGNAAIKDVQPILPIRRIDLTATARDVQPVVPIRRISLPANWTRELQPVESLRPLRQPLQQALQQIDLA